jgi:hypothetical protein
VCHNRPRAPPPYFENFSAVRAREDVLASIETRWSCRGCHTIENDRLSAAVAQRAAGLQIIICRLVG